MAIEKVKFTGTTGMELAGRLDIPDGDIKAYALFAHCFTCTKDIFAASRIASTLVEEGIAVFRFDFTGLGGSDGEFENTNFSSNIQDLIAAANYMREHLQAPRIMIGHSLGGTAVLAAASSVPEVSAVVTIGSPAHAKHVAHNFSEYKERIINDGEAEVCLVGRPFVIKKQFLEDIETIKMERHVSELKKPLLIMHAPLDKTVGIENAGEVFSWAKHPKSYISLDDADHLLSKRADAEYAARIIASWAGKYIS